MCVCGGEKRRRKKYVSGHSATVPATSEAISKEGKKIN